MQNYSKIINRFRGRRILVIGDVILDRYIHGTVSRISPEAPVPIILEKSSNCQPGGSANVAGNLAALGANVSLAGRIGRDADGELLKKRLKAQAIDTRLIFSEKNFPTITKTRILAQHHQMLRIDKEHLTPWISANQKKFRDYFQKNIKTFDAVILSDYGKGVITPALVSFVCELAVRNNVIITVDPKMEHFAYYRHVTSITPNLKETENAIRNIMIRAKGAALDVDGDQLTTDAEIDRAGKELMRFLKLESLLITLGERGMKLFDQDQKPVSIPTQARDVYDVTGAGDTVIAVFTLALTAGASKLEAAKTANAAAGVVVGHLGAVAIQLSELKRAVKEIK